MKRRIMEMGIIKGVEVFVRKAAPLGDPVEVTVRGYELSQRKADAELIRAEGVLTPEYNTTKETTTPLLAAGYVD